MSLDEIKSNNEVAERKTQPLELIIMIGNIGCGKSLIARKFAMNGYVVVNMDSIIKMVAGGEYGHYDPGKKKVYRATEITMISAALKSGISVVIDRTNMSRKKRSPYIELAKQFDVPITGYDWGPGTIQALKQRLSNPLGIPEDQWISVYRNFQDSYETPLLSEGFEEIIGMKNIDFQFYAFDFDRTIVTKEKYPAIGKPRLECIELIKSLWKDLSNIIIIWTCRSSDGQNQMRAFLIKNKIPFDFINENPICDFGSRKVFAHHYYDDRNSFIE